MIKFKDILLEDRLNILVPRRSKEERDAAYKVMINRKIQDYIKNGSKSTLDLSFENITELPPNLKYVGGDLILSYSKIIKLPDNLEVKHGLYLNHTPISELPNGLQIGGTFEITDTSNLRSLPNDIKIGGNLYAMHCNLERLPDNLILNNGELVLRGSRLSQFPVGLVVNGEVDISLTPLAKKGITQNDLDKYFRNVNRVRVYD